MAWTWRYETEDGAAVDPPEAPQQPVHPTQSDAETWIGETWRELLAAGVTHVTLFDDQDRKYRMGLETPTG